MGRQKNGEKETELDGEKRGTRPSYTANLNRAREGWPEMEVPPAGALPIEEGNVPLH